MIALLTLWLATAFPSESKTSWMRPESFHLAIGMNRSETMKALQSRGWKPKKGDKPPVKKKPVTLKDLPPVCAQVLDAAAPASAAEVTLGLQ